MPKVPEFAKGQPIGLVSVGSVLIARGVHLFEDEDGSGSIFIYGMASWFWYRNDVVGRRLAAVQLDILGSATSREIAFGFDVSEPTLWRWRDSYLSKGIDGLSPKSKGPKGPTKLTDEVIDKIVLLRGERLSLRDIAKEVNISHDSVHRALQASEKTGGPTSTKPQSKDLVPLARPVKRTDERLAG